MTETTRTRPAAATRHPAVLRRSIAAVTLWVPAVVLLLGGWALRGTVPERMASHWSAGMRADGFSGTWSFFAVTVAVVVGIAVIGTMVLWMSQDGRLARGLSTVIGSVAALVASVWIASAGVTAAAGSAERAVLGWWLAVVIATLLWGGIAMVLLPVDLAPATDSDRVVPVPTSPGERLAWAGNTGSLVLEWIGALLFLAGVVMLLTTVFAGAQIPVVAWVVMLVAGVASAAVGRARLTVDQRGIRLVTALFGIPLMRIPLDAVASVDVDVIEPMAWGGWGYRTSPGRRAYVAGRGQGLVVTNRSGGLSAITTRDAEEAASVAEALLREHRAVR